MTTKNDDLTLRLRHAAEDKAVSDKFTEEWAAARAFTPARYTQQVLNPGIEAEVRSQHKGKLASEIDAEVLYRQAAEASAMEQLSAKEIEAAAKFGHRPSEYLAAKTPIPVLQHWANHANK